MSEKDLLLWYPFDDEQTAFEDKSGNGLNATPMGETKPQIEEVAGRKAMHFVGGKYGASYLELPAKALAGASDDQGITVSTWVNTDKASNVWERIFDFGHGMTGPYMFLTRFLRGICFNSSDLAADAGKALPDGEWVHVAMTVTGTQRGALSSAGPRVYVNGELLGDGFISQTSSGTYKKLREWFATLEDPSNYDKNYIAHSQYDADADFAGSLSDFRVYKSALSEEAVIDLMCQSLSDQDILQLAKDKFLPSPNKIINEDINLPSSLMKGRVQVAWTCDQPDLISPEGKVNPAKEARGVTLTATLSCGGQTLSKSFQASLLPKDLPPYEITVHGDQKVLDISSTLYGLFYEDINNAADGGIYAELVQNRSFENFTFQNYDPSSGENGISGGRNHNPLQFWFGDLDQVTVKNEGGLGAHLGLSDPEINSTYVSVAGGAKLFNHGFCDNLGLCSMKIVKDKKYHFSIWAKAKTESRIEVALLDADSKQISNSSTIEIKAGDTWEKYEGYVLLATNNAMGQLALHFDGDIDIDMVSLMPGDVWGAKEVENSPSAHKNFKGNSNYRLRRDLMEQLINLSPSFLRFPGGCISEGSYIWDNVYDWKDSVGPVECRKENFNVWGYVMTMGLGYMEYFQMAEDLNAEPLPVMACGVLCQARSDYANPAGGSLQEKYIKNFTDLIDFAISTDMNNKWAALRRDMGHEEPFGLHYLGVGNENWGDEFFASFEDFKYAIDLHMEKNYPGYDLTILSTAGAQADDDAYQQGWKYLAGYKKGGATVAFTDGQKSFDRDVTWYSHQDNYLETIVDEHYYRSNDYLLENADRYNYYYRPYDSQGNLVENQVSKVFVGEYASSEKNTLAGAVAEAAVMTGFEKNSDVVRLAAYAPLFNKVVGDGQYRWTPDMIWFDNETVWRTPNYYVQKLFAENLGKDLLATSYSTYVQGQKISYKNQGGISISLAEGQALLKKLTVTSKADQSIIFEQDFSQELSPSLLPLALDGAELETTDKGLKISCKTPGRHGFYTLENWSDYQVCLEVEKLSDQAEIYVGAGLSGASAEEFNPEKISLHEYCLGCGKYGTGLRVLKDGVEAFKLGDSSSSVFAGNLRACYDEEVPVGSYQLVVSYGDKNLHCHYNENMAVLDCKLEKYNRDVFHSVTRDENHTYIKLVNAEDFNKKVKVNLEDVTNSGSAKLITLTGKVEMAHTPNINNKECELIQPKETKISLKDNAFEIDLPGQSLSIIVM
ncbi:MAG: alpha-L-arabinofuranosidase [Eubacterium sp.]|nr:alpha-L-arabinofuranosidase [Eubacterium sp.]